MKRSAMYTVALLLLISLCALLLVGCNKSDAQDPTSDAGGSEPVGEEFKVFDGKDYVCTFVLPKASTEAEDRIAAELDALLFELTGKNVSFINETAIKSDDKYLFMLGNLQDQDAKSVKSSLGDRESVARIVGNKLIVAFSEEYGGMGIVRAIVEDIVVGDSGDMKLPAGYNEKYKSLPTIDALPKFKYDYTKSIDCGEGSQMTYAANGTLSDYENYCKDIEQAEFKKLYAREAKGNIFTTFVGEDEYIYAYYTQYNASIRIVTGPIETLAQVDCGAGLPETETPYIASVPQPNDGQGYILCLPDGRFIIHDGGYEDEDRVYNTLRELKPVGDITIAAWFISHPHSDHYCAFFDFIKEYASNKTVAIERIVHNYANAEMYNINGTAGLDESAKSVELFFDLLEQYAPEVPVIKAHTGQMMSFGSAVVEVLYTVEDLLPGTLPNINDSSLVIRVTMGGQSIMLLADTAYSSGPILNKLWGDYLKSNIVQMAHHGTYPSVEAIYHSIQGEVLLFSAMYRNVKWYVVDSRYGAQMEAALLYAKDIFVSDENVDKIELPYTPVGNKEEMLEYIKNYS